MSRAEFLLAKYIPDLQRVEPRNIGVIVWTSEATEARFLAEKESHPGIVDGRSIPNYVTSPSAYRQWVTYWRGQIGKAEIIPATGGPRVSRRSPAFLHALLASNKGNFVLTEGGHLLDPIGTDELPSLADHLFRTLVDTVGVEEPRDPTLDELSENVLRDSGYSDHPLFRAGYPVSCPVPGDVNEELEFSNGIGNGVPYHLLQRLALPKSRKAREKNVHDAAWKFENVIRQNVIPKTGGTILILATDEQRNDPEIDRSIRMLESITGVLNLDHFDQARHSLAAIAAGIP